MNILYLGVDKGTTKQRVQALRRLGHGVVICPPEQFVPGEGVLSKIHWETGGLMIAERVRKSVIAAVPTSLKFDCVLVDGGRYVSPALVRDLRSRFGPVALFNHDDPFGWRDRLSWLLFRSAVSEYDLVVVVRTPNLSEAKGLGAKRVLHVYRCADEIAHAPRPISTEDRARFDSDVLFLGTWMGQRGAFLRELRALGVPITIQGSSWQKCPEWLDLRDSWRGPALDDADGCDYSKAIQCAKISLGFLSKGNRDSHTTRSMEIPYMGGLLCAERTDEHLGLYVDGKEAVFWSDVTECAAICRELLANDEKRAAIAHNGRIRALQNANTNEALGRRILDALVPVPKGVRTLLI